ncbi:ankyrin [Aspergillus steynii IBT 23096]|uniref:Ankyrin n=1 Tax=Aspergillus steynii IBT 23096 TaxID=1392250 RepID=A0A2I2G9U8_9EURO|nr:ankyrin [Aspergillus steynii IBT 23096]PLB49657.1 ankyrin [Aspergillus steynii IBT 23096]
MSSTLPSLPVKHHDLVPWIRNHPDTPIDELIKPYNEHEAVVRKLFAQEPSNPLLQNNHLNITPLYDQTGSNDVRTRARNPAAETPEVREKYVLPLRDDARRPNGSPAIVPSLNEFKKNFNIFSELSLSDMDWSNVVVAGSAVVTSLLPVPEKYRSSKRALRQFYHDKFAPASDVDLFLYGLTEEEAIAKIKLIEDKVKNAILYETTTVRTKNTITIVSQYPTRHVQIVLRIYKSIAEILTGFDVDCSCAAYDGNQVYVSPRALAAYVTQTNQIDLSRRSPSYENRLSKYSHRGFEIFWPALDRSRVDPTIFERSFSRTVGLARLLVLEKLPRSSDREQYMDQRRQERGRPARVQRGRNGLNGNIKGDWEDETPEWMEGDEVSEYNTVTIPYGPRFHAKRIEKLLYTKDLLLNAEWNKPKTREVHLHRHPAFFGTVEDVIHDCCGHCPEPVTPEEKEVAGKESKTYISGEISFIKDDPGRQEVGSFNPITETDWTEMAYIGNTERLCHAIVDHDLDAVKDWLAGEPADPNSRDYTGRAPLHLACMTSTPAIVQCLVDHGARLTARVADGRTALHIAAARGSVDIVRILLHKSEENEAEEDKKAELRRAKTAQDAEDALEDTDEDVEVISNKDGASSTGSYVHVEKESEDADTLPGDENNEEPDIYDINVISWDTRTSPLHLAILHGQVGVVEELVSSFGADVLLPIKLLNSYDNNPRAAILTLVLALRLPMEQAKAMTEKLLRLGATPTQADLDHNTPLHYIAATSYHELLDVFVKYNKPATQKALNHCATNGQTWRPIMYSTLMMAIAAKDSATAVSLLEHGAPPFLAFENWFKSAAAGAPYIRSNQGDTNMENFRHDTTQPIVQAVFEELPTVVLEVLKRGADPNTLSPSGHKVRDSGYEPRYDMGKSLLDCVRDKLQELRQYKGEHQVGSDLRQLEPHEVYLDGLQEGSYKMWVAKEQIQDAEAEYEKEMENQRQRARRYGEEEGVEEKKEAVSSLIQEFERVEQTLVDMQAKTFREIFPDIEPAKPADVSNSPPYTPEPFKLKFDFHIHELTDEKRVGYFKLFEAAWSGDLPTVQALTLGMWGDENKQQPLQISAMDWNRMTPFSIAVLRGHLEMANVMLEIAQAQYKVVETKRDQRYEMDDASDEGDSDSDGSEGIRITSEVVDDKFTVDDIGALDFDAGSTDSPSDMLGRLYPVSIFIQKANSSFGQKRFKYDGLFEYAIWTDNAPVLALLLEMGQKYQARDEETEPRIYTIDEDLVYMAIEHGRTRCLEEIISRTGADLPINELVKNSGVQLQEKPKYYQGLSIHGRKRADWAAGGRETHQPDTNQTPPLLVSAFRGSLPSCEYFLGTAPARHYLNFTKSHAEDKRLKLLAQSSDGVEKSITKWLSTRSHLVLHCAVMAKTTPESTELVQYLITHHTECIEAKSLAGHTPLALAYALRRVEFAKLLINAGANQAIRDGSGNNLVHLMLCGMESDGLEVPDNVTKLLSLLDTRLVYSMLTERSSDGPGSLTPLARWINETLGRRYYRRGLNFNLETDERVEIVRSILDFAAPTNQKHLEMLDGTGNTPVHDAVKAQVPRIFELMIDRRPDLLHRENSTGTTPLELAVDAWVTEATANPPSLPSKTSSDFWDGREDECRPVVDRDPASFLPKPPLTSERKTICDISRARAGTRSEKRKLVSLNEANEVAKRLAVQSEAKARAARDMERRNGDDYVEEVLRTDEVMKWYGTARCYDLKRNTSNSLDWGDEKVPDPVHHESVVPAIVTIENFRVLGMDPQDEEFYMNFSMERRKKVKRKVDIRLVPMLAVLYLISHLDRSNIGNAKIEGLVDDLGLSGIQWNIVLSIFFVPYVLLGMSSSLRPSRPS